LSSLVLLAGIWSHLLQFNTQYAACH